MSSKKTEIELKSTLGERFFSLRKKSGQSMREFGESIGVSSGYINDIEKDKGKKVSHKVILLASCIFKVNFNWLLTGATDEGYSLDFQKNNGDENQKEFTGEDNRMLYKVIQELAILMQRVEKLESQLNGNQKKNQSSK